MNTVTFLLKKTHELMCFFINKNNWFSNKNVTVFKKILIIIIKLFI